MSGYIINLGGPDDTMSICLETRKKSYIKNVVRRESPPEIRKEKSRIITEGFPDVQLLSTSAVYNCYGLAFASRRTSIVGDDDISTILADDGYYRRHWTPDDWLPGDVVLYKPDQSVEISHVAIIVQIEQLPDQQPPNVWVISAWGESGEYRHIVDYVSPLLGKPYAVYSQRLDT